MYELVLVVGLWMKVIIHWRANETCFSRVPWYEWFQIKGALICLAILYDLQG